MKKFKHLKTGEIAIYQDGVLKSSGFCVEIGVEPSSEFWEEIIEKPVLLITTDNVKVYKDDMIYGINLNWKIFYVNIKEYFMFKSFNKDEIFFTKKAAENYIACNKPCLSFNDVWNISNNKSSDNHYVVIDKRELKKLAESRAI